MNGLQQMMQRLALAEAALQAGAEDGVYKAAEHVLGVSNEHVPHEEGTLERSGRVTTDNAWGTPTAAISYDTPYAVVMHEDLTARHDPGRTAKYLENAVNGERTTAGRIIARSVETMLERAAKRR